MRAYSVDLRERVVADRAAGLGTAEVARKYRVSPAWVRRLMQRYRASGQGRGPQAPDAVSAAALSPPSAPARRTPRGAARCHAGGTAHGLGRAGRAHHGVAGGAAIGNDSKKKSCTRPNKHGLMW